MKTYIETLDNLQKCIHKIAIKAEDPEYILSDEEGKSILELLIQFANNVREYVQNHDIKRKRINYTMETYYLRISDTMLKNDDALEIINAISYLVVRKLSSYETIYIEYDHIREDIYDSKIFGKSYQYLISGK